VSNFRKRPKDSYIQEADWAELYVLTEHWKSDLEFYNDDLKFLHHLIDKYFMWISKKENIDMVRQIEVGLVEMDNQSSKLLQHVNTNLHHLAELMDNPFAYDSNKFRTEHQQIEDDLASFVKSFRKNRKAVFSITEHVIDAEEMVRRLNLIPK